MTPTQVRKIAQDKFEADGALLGKRCYIHRLPDTTDIRNRGKVGNPTLARQPADYVVAFPGEFFYAEVKGSSSPGNFPLSRFEPSQLAAMRQIQAASPYIAEDFYKVFIWSIPANCWFVLTGEDILEAQDKGLKSINLSTLTQEGFSYDHWTSRFSD